MKRENSLFHLRFSTQANRQQNFFMVPFKPHILLLVLFPGQNPSQFYNYQDIYVTYHELILSLRNYIALGRMGGTVG